jgi:hypothetical protein
MQQVGALEAAVVVTRGAPRGCPRVRQMAKGSSAAWKESDKLRRPHLRRGFQDDAPTCVLPGCRAARHGDDHPRFQGPGRLKLDDTF